jgi:hypothetical protein
MIDLEAEEWVYNYDTEAGHRLAYHETCWLDGLNDSIFHNIVTRHAMTISRHMGYESALLESLK